MYITQMLVMIISRVSLTFKVQDLNSKSMSLFLERKDFDIVLVPKFIDEF